VTARAFDVAIVGGGPAGSAAGLSLRAHAPALSVALLEASAYDTPRLGETLPPLARRLLEHLGIWDAFQQQTYRETHGTAAAWGSPVPYDHDFLFTAQGVGWHLDRTAFDAFLADEAENRGVTVLRQARVRQARREPGAWRLRMADDKTLTARFLIDATGSSAMLARRCGARFEPSDRLAGFARLFEEKEPSDPRTLVEACTDGWWYTAGLPGGLRIVACLTDTDLARPLRLNEPAGWTRHLASAPTLRELLRDAQPRGRILVRATPSRRLEPASGDGWLAVGDAASLFDPLSSQGILKGLRSGIFASYAIGDFLTQQSRHGLERYNRYIRDEFASYRRVQARYYAEERRWPESEFWRRRSE
jgi:flavin-dependent dehydrogenase